MVCIYIYSYIAMLKAVDILSVLRSFKSWVLNGWEKKIREVCVKVDWEYGRRIKM